MKRHLCGMCFIVHYSTIHGIQAGCYLVSCYTHPSSNWANLEDVTHEYRET